MFALLRCILFLEKYQMATLNPQVQALVDDVTQLKTVKDSVLALIAGFPQLLADAVAKAVANGVDPDDLAAITQVGTDIQAASSQLAAGVVAGTPAAPPTP